MSNVIELLEQLGADASLQTPESFEQAIQQSGLSAELKKALLTCEAYKAFILASPDESDEFNSAKALLEQETGAVEPTCFILVPAEGDDDENENENEASED